MTSISNYTTVTNHEEAISIGGTNTYFSHTDLPGYTIAVGGIFIDSAEAILFGITEDGGHLSFSIATDDTGYLAVTLTNYDYEMSVLGNNGHGKLQYHNTSKELHLDDSTGVETYIWIETLTITTIMYFEFITGLHEGVLVKANDDDHVDFDHYIGTTEGRRSLDIWNALDHNLNDRDPSDFIDILQNQYDQYFVDGDDSDIVNITPLAIGAVSQVISWTGAVYGLSLPDNLHPCDGTIITNVLSPLVGQSAPDYQGRGLVGTGSLPYSYTGTDGYVVTGTQEWNNNTKRGIPYSILTTGNIPRIGINIPARTGTISGTALSKRAVGEGYTMWCFPNSTSDWWNTGADMSGSGWKYAATQGPEYMTTGTHSHTVTGTCTVSATSTIIGQMFASKMDRTSPSIGVDMYIILY